MAIESFDASLPKGTDNQVIQVAAKIKTQDNEVTPNVSPLTVDTASGDEIVIPANAAILILRPFDEAVRFGENSATLDGSADNGYNKIPAGQAQAIACANGDSVFVKSDSATDCELHFHFEMLTK